jgi:hypothetical protein
MQLTLDTMNNELGEQVSSEVLLKGVEQPSGVVFRTQKGRKRNTQKANRNGQG